MGLASGSAYARVHNLCSFFLLSCWARCRAYVRRGWVSEGGQRLSPAKTEDEWRRCSDRERLDVGSSGSTRTQDILGGRSCGRCVASNGGGATGTSHQMHQEWNGAQPLPEGRYKYQGPQVRSCPLRSAWAHTQTVSAPSPPPSPPSYSSHLVHVVQRLGLPAARRHPLPLIRLCNNPVLVPPAGAQPLGAANLIGPHI